MAGLKPIITLNNADGFNKRETAILNRALLAERNRWAVKATQPVDVPKIQDSLEELSGMVSAHQTQSYNGITNMMFYLNLSLMKYNVETELATFKNKILTYQIVGNATSPGFEEYDISKYCLFYCSNNKLYGVLTKQLRYDDPTIFYINITVETE